MHARALDIRAVFSIHSKIIELFFFVPQQIPAGRTDDKCNMKSWLRMHNSMSDLIAILVSIL